MGKKVLILNDGSEYKNWGIKACIDGLKKILRQDFDEKDIYSFNHQYMHRLYSFDPKIFGRSIFLENSRVAKKLFKPFHLLPKNADEFEYVAEEWINGRGGKGADEFINKMEDIDIAIFNSEGSVYRDNICGIKGLFMLWFTKKKLGKKACFVNGSVTLTMVQAVLPAMIKKVALAIDIFNVREGYSKQNIIDYYPELTDKIQVFPDSVFALEKTSSSAYMESNLKGSPYFVFSLSMLPMDYSKDRDQSSVLSLINDLKKIIPNAVLLAKDIEDQDLKYLAHITGSHFIGSDYEYNDVMNILEKAEFLCSGRYHHLIFAIMVGCPVIPLHTSSQKIWGLSSFFKENMLSPIDPTDLYSESYKILNEAKKIVESGNDLRIYYKNKSKELGVNTLIQSGQISNI
jgi:polysaccharide pyruvyl transferase WcaK-like protein